MKKIRNAQKSEISTGAISKFIIIMVSLVVLLYLIIFVFRASPDTKNICRDSAQMMSSMPRTAGSQKFIQQIKLKCPLINIKITTPDKHKAMRQIAEAMRDTWYVFGEGKFNLFFYNGKNTFCLFHDLISFDGKGKKLQISYNDLLNFLDTQKMTGTNEKYCKYLFGTCPDSDKFSGYLKSSTNSKMFNTEHSYAVMYNYSKLSKQQWSKISGASLSTGVALVTGGIVIGIFTGGIALPFVFVAFGTIGTTSGIMIHDVADPVYNRWTATLSVIDLNKMQGKLSYCKPDQSYDTPWG